MLLNHMRVLLFICKHGLVMSSCPYVSLNRIVTDIPCLSLVQTIEFQIFLFKIIFYTLCESLLDILTAHVSVNI